MHKDDDDAPPVGWDNQAGTPGQWDELAAPLGELDVVLEPEPEDPVAAEPPEPEDLAALAAWEPPPTPGSLAGLLPNKWMRRLVAGAIPVLAVGFCSALIVVSQLRVSHSLQAFGSAAGGRVTSAPDLQAGLVRAELVSGRPNAFWVALWNRRGRKHEQDFGLKVVLSGGSPARRLTLYDGKAGPGPVAAVNASLPILPPGIYTMQLTAKHGDQRLEAKVSTRVVAPGVGPRPRPIEPHKAGDPPPEQPRPDAKGRLVLLLPQAGRKVPGQLPEQLFLRATGPKGRPLLARVSLRLLQGRLGHLRPGHLIGEERRVDALGLADLQVVSRHPALKIEASYQVADDATGLETANPFRRELRFGARTSQAAVHPTALIVAPGALLELTAQSLTQTGLLYVELLAQGRRQQVSAVRVHKGAARFSLKAPTGPGLFRVQTTDDFSNPGTGTAVRTLFVFPGGSRAPGALVALARAVRAALPSNETHTAEHIDALLAGKKFSQGGFNRRRATAYLLTRLDHLHHPIAWLAETSRDDSRRLTAYRRRLQKVLVAGLAFTTLLLLMVVVPLVRINIRLQRDGAREREALMQEFEGGDAAGQAPRGTPTRQEKVERWRHLLQIILVSGVILLFAASILVLLTNLNWGWDQ